MVRGVQQVQGGRGDRMVQENQVHQGDQDVQDNQVHQQDQVHLFHQEGRKVQEIQDDQGDL